MEIPPPDVDERPQFEAHLVVVETIYADENWARVSITRNERGIYRVHPERWEISDLAMTGHAYWNPQGLWDPLTDDIEIARRMATEELRKIRRSRLDP